jgi:hypothetical protein
VLCVGDAAEREFPNYYLHESSHTPQERRFFHHLKNYVVRNLVFVLTANHVR